MRSFVAFAFVLAACGDSTTTSHPDGGAGGCPAGQAKFDGICATLPTLEAVRTKCGDVTEFCDPNGVAAPALACIATPKMPSGTGPKTVTLTGWVHPFSGGKSNATVRVEVFKETDLATGADLAKVTPIATKDFPFDPSMATDPTQFRACDADPAIGCVPVAPATCMGCLDGLSGRQDHTQYCRAGGGAMGTCSTRLRWERRFSLDNIPTNTPLVIRTTGEGGMPSTAWNTIIQWNVYLGSDDKSCGGDVQATDCLDTTDMAHAKYQFNVVVLSQADYTNIPFVAGLAGGISPGLGAIAGEVRDCDNIRVGNVQMAVQPAGDRLTYFNGNPIDTKPDSSRAGTGTDRLGLFSSLNVAPGKGVVEAVGLASGKQTTFGKYTLWIYPAVVSVVNINGGKPQQAN